MRPPTASPANVSLFILLLLSPTTAISIDCSDIVVDKKQFNLKPLDGPHSLYTIREHPPIRVNTTFTIDICRPLEKTKGVPKKEDCPNGSRVCAREQLTNTIEDTSMTGNVIPIAGEFSHATGGALDPKWTRLKTSASNADRAKEGLRLEMNGGSFEKKKQKAIVEFICQPGSKDVDRKRDEFSRPYEEDDDEKNGNEGGEDEQTGEVADDGRGGKLEFISWEDEKDVMVLRLEWDTKYACEDAKDSGGDSSSGHWGFFTWFIIIVFMGVAAYLIFGSWLNYNRYSARGWDLVPHSETIRDIPYLFRDWMRRVVNTVQGGGSRGGYSAV